MKERQSVEAFPLQWPAGWPRTKVIQNSKFKTTTDKARLGLLNEVSRMGGNGAGDLVECPVAC